MNRILTAAALSVLSTGVLAGGIPDRATGWPAGATNPYVSSWEAPASSGASRKQAGGSAAPQRDHGGAKDAGSANEPIDRGVGHTPGRQPKP